VVGVQPTQFLQLAGHPLRWDVLTELARSDRTVAELTGLVGEKQNLVSYHLGKLRDAGLVVARRSAADGRDAYYAVDLTRFRELLAATASTLHPGLGAPRPVPRSRGRRRPRVLFLCTGNSARSQMAEALLRERAGGAVEAFSAGSHPKVLHPNAVRAMRARGIDISGNTTRSLDVFANQQFDWVITLCDKVREVCPEFPGEPEAIHWSIADPSAGDLGVFQELADELEHRIGYFLAVLGS
jgi:protein-tyrosine-phosphatase